MEKWYQAIGRRCSIRSYRSNLTAKQLADLQEFANGIESHGIRIAIGRSNKIFAGKLFTAKVTGTDCFAAIISTNGKDVYAGYLGELFILECVSRGYGTCWLGASFKMGAAQEAIELKDGETIVCVTPIGIPADEYVLRQRKSISKLTGLEVQEFRELPKWQQCAIESARRAPSAMNRQPWEFEVYDGKLGVVNISNNLGYGLLDCGIAMLHMELGAAHFEVSGNWNMDADDEAIFEADIENENDSEGFDDEYDEFDEELDDDKVESYNDDSNTLSENNDEFDMDEDFDFSLDSTDNDDNSFDSI